MNIIEHYPETLRDIHDQILDAISGEDVTEPAAVVALQVTDWIRRSWGARTMTRKWWGLAKLPAETDPNTSTLVEVDGDQVRSIRGRELRAAAWSILAGSAALWREHGWRDICRTATVIAVTVETEWSRTAVYVPKGENVDRAIRDAAVWRQFDGLATIDQVIESHNLCQRQIYHIARRLQREKDLREQPSLPGF